MSRYYKDASYNFLNHILADAVAFQVRSIGREKGLVVVSVQDVDISPVLEHVKMAIDYALEQKDILSVEEIF